MDGDDDPIWLAASAPTDDDPGFAYSSRRSGANFPSCYPMIHHDISSLGEKMSLATRARVYLVVHTLLSLANAIASFHILFITPDIPTVLQMPTSAFAVSNVLLTPLLNAVLVYKAAEKPGALRYGVAILAGGFMVLICGVFAIGIPGMSAGLLNGVVLRWWSEQYSRMYDVYNFGMPALWSFLGFAYICLTWDIYKYFQRDGHNMDEAVAEFKKMFQKYELDCMNCCTC